MKSISVVLMLCFALAFWLSCGKERQAIPEMIRPVRYVQVFNTGGGRERVFSGTARAGVESKLSFKVPGTVRQVLVKVGDAVQRGQLLAQLDSKDYQLQLQQAEAAYQQANAGLQKASSDYDRVRNLYENNNAAKSDLDAVRAAFESATAGVQAADKQRELARLQRSYARLAAPAAGLIAAVNVEPNENIQAGQPVVLLTSAGDLEVDVTVPEVLISSVKKGSDVKVTFDAISDKVYQGIVAEVGVASIGFATTYPATVRLLGADSRIRSGMAAEVKLQFSADSTAERIVIPSVAVAEDRDGRFVFVVQPVKGDTARAKRVPVEVGELTSDGLEILSGLSEGELVVTAGVSKIKDGQRVRL